MNKKSLLLIILTLLIPHKVIFASNFTKYQNNPILKYGQNPALVIKDGQYKMWYDVNYGSGWRINYAYSIDGISNWITPYTSIIPIGSIDGFEMDISNPYVMYDSNQNIYKMWYSSIGTNWSSGDDRFRLRYATSQDGINWTKLDKWVLTGTLNSWDSGGIARGLSILLLNGKYHMWYAGTDAGWNWKIGYAKSDDGINWIKQNNGLPIITPTESWEQTDLEYPNVLFNNNLFEMYYTSGSSDLPDKIIYATSTDGIIWTKPSNINPILTGTLGGYDGIFMTGPFAIKNSTGVTNLWYSGDSSYILLASNGDFNTTIPTPTPIPTPPKDVIIVPGFAGSWNTGAIVNCSLDDVYGPWEMFNPAYFLAYEPIITQLKSQGLNPIYFAYDWRKQVPFNGSKLHTFIQNLFADRPLSMIGHSMGGLVGRSFLETAKSESNIDRFMSVGSPFQGTPEAYAAWEGGDSINKNLPFRMGLTAIIKYCNFKKYPGDGATVRAMVPSIQNLLPRFDYLRTFKEYSVIPNQIHAWQNNLPLDTSFGNPYYGTRVETLSGLNSATYNEIIVKSRSKHDEILEDWPDGKPHKFNSSFVGDGTVLTMSSQLNTAPNTTINQDHTGIIASNEGINTITAFLGYPSTLSDSLTTFTQDTALMIIGYPGEITLVDPEGKQHKSTDSYVTVINPKKGMYKLEYTPQQEQSTLSIIQFLKNNTIWKDYTLLGHQKHNKTLNVDFSQTNENILQ